MELFGFKFTPMRTLVIATLVVIAMATPSIRRIIWWLLPLGSGYDDIVGGLALVVIFTVLFVEIWTKFNPSKNYRKRNKKSYEDRLDY